MKSRAVIVFCQDGCAPCEWVKAFLEVKGVAFEERDVRTDPNAVRELVEKYRSNSTPTVIVGDEVMIGFDPERLEKMLSD